MCFLLQNIQLISSESPESFVDDTPTSVLIQRVLSCLIDFEKNSIVEKLRGSRLRKRSVMKEKGVITRQGRGRVEGRKTLIETHPELEGLVKNYSKTMSNSKISEILESEHGLKIHRTSKWPPPEVQKSSPSWDRTGTIWKSSCSCRQTESGTSLSVYWKTIVN